jgi:DNA-binding CsgD family transcriptional regulator
MIMEPSFSRHQSTVSLHLSAETEVYRFAIKGHEIIVVKSGNNDTKQDVEVCSFFIGSDRYSLIWAGDNEAHDHRVITSAPDLISPPHEALSGSGVATLLTARELQIASLVANGQSNKQISKSLKISEWTVSSHLRRIFLKLGVDSRAAMVFRCASLLVASP